MSTLYKYYLNGYEYAPINTGGFTFDYNLMTDAGAYHFEKSLNGSINFKGPAYDYILQHGDCQKIELTIKEFCTDGEFIIFDLFFTHHNCKFSPDQKIIEVTTKQNTLYQCLTDNYDREFNFLEVPTVVNSVYAPDFGNLEYLLNPIGFFNFELPFWGNPVPNPPFIGAPAFGPFAPPDRVLFVRDTLTTYCQGGEPQKPTGADWELYVNSCETENLATWARPNPIFQNPALPVLVGITMSCNTPACIPPHPTTDPLVVLFRPLAVWVKIASVTYAGGNVDYWLDWDTVKTTGNIDIDNGRPLVEVINHGLNQHCSELDLQSQFLNNPVNPVTGQTPSPTEGVQMHAISDAKDPTATEPATRELITIQSILNDYISSKLNCFWRIDEGTKRLIIEHYKDINTQNTTDLTAIDGGKWLQLKNKFEYDNSDIPKAEAFPSLDSSVDFTGVNIEFNNDCAEGVKSYNTDKFYSEIESIINDPVDYPADGVVMITPDSLAPIGNVEPSAARSELGAITHEYKPNAPQGMANLQANFWPYYRPFNEGKINFVDQAFINFKPVKQLETITVPVCCLFFFDPYSQFIGNNFSNGQLKNASFNPKSGFITLQILY